MHLCACVDKQQLLQPVQHSMLLPFWHSIHFAISRSRFDLMLAILLHGRLLMVG
jgi:hypothetical protein